jgi:hypothetical protein
MEEFMFLVRNKGDHHASQSPADQKQFLLDCERYIGRLKKEGKLIAAQPLVRQGAIVSKAGGAWMEDPVTAAGELQVGYYHILANDLNEAIAIAKDNPEFAYGTTARIEVRPIKTKEVTTGFTYPKTT